MTEYLYDSEDFEDEDLYEPTSVVDHEARAQLAQLADSLGLRDERSAEQVAAVSLEISDLETEYGHELDEEDFERVGQLSEELGDVEAAFRLVFAEDQQAIAEWEQDFQRGIKQAAEERGYDFTESEQNALREAQEDVGEPDVKAALQQLYPDGNGKHDIESRDGRRDYMAERFAAIRKGEEPEAKALAPLSPDASRQEARAWATARLDGAEVAQASTNAEAVAATEEGGE